MNLVALFEEALEFQNFNGTVLSNGKVKVYYIGRTSLADIYNDVAGEYPSENPQILDNLGMGPIYVNPAFDYEIVVYDEYDNELFSVKKYLHSSGAHSTSNVEVVPSENIQVSAWTQGDVQVYMPYITGNLGKVYSGIEPIVVNNDEDKISANHVPLGLQEPLFFVEDSESACVIGIDSSACGKTYSGISPILVDNTANTISITGDIGKDWTEEILSAANDASAAATAWTDSQGYLTGVDLNDYAKKDFVISSIDSSTSGLLPTSSFSSVSGSFLTALPSDVAYTGWVENSIVSATSGLQSSGNYIPYTATDDSLTAFETNSGLVVQRTAVGGLKSTYIGNNVQVGYVGPNSTNRWAILSNNQLKFETDSNGAYDSAYLDKEKIHKLDSASDYIQNSSATINEVNASYQTNSGNFLTAIPAGTMYESAFEYDANDNISGYNGSAFAAGGGSELPQSAIEAIEAVTANSADWNEVSAKQPSGNYYSASNPSGFITGIPDDLTLKSLLVNGIIESTESEQEGVNISQTGIQLYSDIDGVEDVTITAVQNWNSTYETVSTNSANWTATTIPDELTAAASAVSSNSATWDSVTDKLDTTAFSTVSSTFLTAHQDLSDYQTIAGMTAYQPAGDYLTTADSAQFITALPADLVYTADIQDMATTGDLTAYAQNSALADKLDTSAFSSVSGNYLVGSNVSGFVITATGDGFSNGMTVAISQDTSFAGMYFSESDINGSKQIYIDPEQIMFYSAGEFSTSEAIDAGDIATLKTLSSSKQDNLTFSYTTANEISAINSSAIAGSTGSSFPSSANDACEVVTANSANWNSTYNTVTANSADWSVSEEISGINGIKISESADKVIIEVSADYYLASNPSGFITGINYNTGSI